MHGCNNALFCVPEYVMVRRWNRNMVYLVSRNRDGAPIQPSNVETKAMKSNSCEIN